MKPYVVKEHPTPGRPDQLSRGATITRLNLVKL
jgi:hypothetical protein